MRHIHANRDGSMVLTEDERVQVLAPGADVEAAQAAFFTPVEIEPDLETPQ